MKSVIKPTIVAMLFVVSIITLLPSYEQESTTNSIKDLVKTTAEQIKNMADEVANNSTEKINQTEAKNILMQLGEAAKKAALGGADILSNISGEIKEGLQN
ncbi:MAG: hypothetical protein ACM3VV_00040 [Deltaproteobacteria bacterium]|jgi:hypothetical protein